jgi:hypothetical protein
MLKLTKALSTTTAKWRRTARQTRLAAGEIPNLLARGHMHGMSDGLDVAAEDVDALINANGLPPVDAQ